MNKKLLTVAAMLLMSASALLMTSCEKWGNDPITPQPEPKQEMITQSFGMKLLTDVSPMNKETKSWDAATWVFNYSTDPANLVLTGTGPSAGQNYTKSCTVAELQTPGAVLINMLPGTYNITYQTAHKWTTDPFTLSGHSINEFRYCPEIGDVLDIKVVNNDVNITSTPIELKATCDDALIIVDVPNVENVTVSESSAFTGTNGLMLRDVINKFHFAYISTAPAFLKFTANTVRIVDASAYQKGNAYHLISAFDAATTLSIPGMIVNNVVVPQ